MSTVTSPEDAQPMWNQIKVKNKVETKSSALGKSKSKLVQTKKGPQAPSQQPPPRMDQENKFAPLSSQIKETQEPNNQKSTPPSKGTPSSPKGASLPESSKGNTIEVEEDEHESDCSEEEGEIGESQTSIKRSTTGFQG